MDVAREKDVKSLNVLKKQNVCGVIFLVYVCIEEEMSEDQVRFFYYHIFL